MHTPAKLVQRLLIAFTLAEVVGAQQQPPQFKANVTMKDGSDGSTSSGTMYFGGAKMRTELTLNGQNVIALVDPAAKLQYLLMPSEKTYMQMPIGQGPGGTTVTITGPSDPTNPCAGGSGNTDCARGDKETMSGYETIRWDYTSSAGVRTRAWISTKLRFPIKTQDDDGSIVEISNIAEGPQPASLFGIPTGYQKMDMGMMGGPGSAGRGRGRSSGNDPVAAMMGNLPPDQQAAMAAALRGERPKGPVSATGSAWEKGNGFTLSVTITAAQAEGPTTVNGKGGSSTERKSYSIKWTASMPLNYGSPAAGVPGAPGPMWTLAAGARGVGTAAAAKVPVSLSVTTEAKFDRSVTSDCKSYGEEGPADPGTYQERMSTTTQKSVPVTELSTALITQGNLTLSADLKTYDLRAGVIHAEGQEVTKSHEETTGCLDKQLHKEDKTINPRTADYKFTLDLKGEPLPATVSTISGSKKMPVQIDGRTLDATVSWTITPIP